MLKVNKKCFDNYYTVLYFNTVKSKILLHSNSTPLISNQHPSGACNNLRLDGN